MISKEAFEQKFKTMPWKRRQVLEAVVGGQTDEAIKEKVLRVYDVSTVRNHISKIYKDFDIEANGFNCRCELVEIVNTYKPELVADQVLKEYELSSYRYKADQYKFIDKSLDQSKADQEIYIERPPIEARCYQEIVKPGALIRIKAPKRMGKTLLIQNIIAHGEKQAYGKVYLNINQLPFTNLDIFLKSFCLQVGNKLKLPNQLQTYWDDSLFTSVDNCTAYFEEYLLASLESPLVLCLDDLDRVFHHQEIAEGFLPLLRSWHESGKFDDSWKKLRLVVAHATEFYINLDINKSPFNVGLPIELLEFDAEQVKRFAESYGLMLSVDSVTKLMAMVGGHPDLLSQAFDYLKNNQAAEKTLDTLLANAPTEAGIYGSHLYLLLTSIQEHPQLLDAVKLLLSTTNPVRLDATITRKLESMGLVERHGNDCSLISNLYRQYFSDRILGKREQGVGSREEAC
ncbi:AAA-like domain-containing protein [Moorena producens JHB]|uniref:AAA-like domain-containing protein n=1 Tax=Moorena producens (strain JHB) TaxID=1454205 RepID=A0A1D9FW53_MOOP1|nr:AAA-like domain-containing protein [Moorena producens]AOY79504.1 AAA-like domain-containing protein [Moorena producens JHB]